MKSYLLFFFLGAAISASAGSVSATCEGGAAVITGGGDSMAATCAGNPMGGAFGGGTSSAWYIAKQVGSTFDLSFSAMSHAYEGVAVGYQLFGAEGGAGSSLSYSTVVNTGGPVRLGTMQVDFSLGGDRGYDGRTSISGGITNIYGATFPHLYYTCADYCTQSYSGLTTIPVLLGTDIDLSINGYTGDGAFQEDFQSGSEIGGNYNLKFFEADGDPVQFATPEPMSLGLAGLPLIALLVWRRKRA